MVPPRVLRGFSFGFGEQEDGGCFASCVEVAFETDWRFRELYGLSAELAAGGGYRDVAEALGAGLGGRGGDDCGMKFLQQVLGGDDEEEVDDAGDEEEVDNGGDEFSVLDGTAVEVADEVVEVGLADDGSEERVDDSFSQRGDDGRECGSDDDGDSKIDDVATQNEIAESFEHVVSLLRSVVPGTSRHDWFRCGEYIAVVFRGVTWLVDVVKAVGAEAGYWEEAGY
jgi:hypothetical protein